MKKILAALSRLILLLSILLVAQNCSDEKQFENLSDSTAFGLKPLKWDEGSWDKEAWSDE